MNMLTRISLVMTVTLVFDHLLPRLEATLSERCQSKNQDYATFGYLEEVVRLGSSDQGTLLYGNTRQMYCIGEIDVHTMQVQTLDEGSSAEKTCLALISEFESLLDQKKLHPNDLKFILPFGSKIYYYDYSLNAFQTHQITKTSVKFNQEFEVARDGIHKWINSKLNNYQNEAVILIRTSEDTPQYPSLIISTSESGHPATFYFHKSNVKTGEGHFYEIGTSRYNIKALYVQHRTYAPTMTALAFFDVYYGQVHLKLDETKTRKDEVVVFPVLPVQSLIGCPIHVCWWPYVEEIVFHDGLYYLFQGQWMYIYAEGTIDYDPLNVENVIDLHAFGIKNFIYAAFFDPFSNIIRLVHHGKTVQEHVAQGVKVILANGASPKTASLELADEIRFAVDIQRGEKVITSVILSGILWLAVTEIYKKDQTTIQFHGFIHDNKSKQFKHKMTIAKTPHQSMMAMFYHPHFNHLFIVSGFFLYIYQVADLNQIESSFCSVTPFYRFYNCSGYHDLPRMNMKEPVIESMAKFTENAQTYHQGEFLPGQCNYMEDLKLTGKIHFEPKIESFITFGGYKMWIILIAIVGGIAFAGGLYFYFAGTCRVGKRQGPKRHSSISRRSKEKRLKQFLKQQLLGKGSNKSSKSLYGKNNNKSTASSNDTRKRKGNRTSTVTSTATSTTTSTTSNFGSCKKK